MQSLESFCVQENDVNALNATTAPAHVNYYFGTPHKHFLKFLDQYVNIFVSPTMSLDDIKTEREAVDSGIGIQIQCQVLWKRVGLAYSNPPENIVLDNINTRSRHDNEHMLLQLCSVVKN